MDSEQYCTVPDDGMVPSVEEALGDVWNLMHGGASVLRFNHTMNWIEGNDVHVLE